MDRMNVFSSGKDKARERVLFKFRLFYNAVETLEDACAQPYNVYIRDSVIKGSNIHMKWQRGFFIQFFKNDWPIFRLTLKIFFVKLCLEAGSKMPFYGKI